MKKFCSGLMLLAGLCHTAAADVVVNWGGDYVSSTTDLAGTWFSQTSIDADGDSLPDDSVVGLQFSDSTPMSPGAPYGTSTGQSATFYGGMTLIGQDHVEVDRGGASLHVQNKDVDDAVNLKLSHGSNLHNLRAAFLWDQADFLNGGNPFTFDAASTVSFTMGAAGSETLNNSEVRLLVRDQDGYWLSQTSFFDPSNNQSFTWNAGNQGFGGVGSDGGWAQYNPTSTFPGVGLSGTDLRFTPPAIWSPRDFGNITGIGFLFEQDNFHNNLDFAFTSFTVNAASVPEPASLAGCVVLLASGGLWRVRKNRKVSA